MSVAVIDANVAAALLLDLAYSQNARDSLDGVQTIIAPDLVHAEFANALWKLVSGDRLTETFAHQAIAGLESLVSEFVAGRSLAHEALRIAVAIRHPVYDCLYLALAASRQAPLVTADRRLAARLAETPFAERLRVVTP